MIGGIFARVLSVFRLLHVLDEFAVETVAVTFVAADERLDDEPQTTSNKRTHIKHNTITYTHSLATE